jgi:hypothetical protein
VAGDVHPVAVDAQRVVDPDRGPLGVGAVQLVADVGGVGRRGPVLLVLGLEVVEVDAQRGEVAAVDQRAGRVGVVLLEGVAEPLALGDQDAALVPPQLAAGQAEQQRQQRQVEQHVAGLAQVALLRGDLLARPALAADHPEPADPQLLLDHVQRGRPGQGGGQLGALRQPVQVPRGRRRRGEQRPPVLDRPGHHAADQRDEQQQVDRREPRRAEDVEQVQPVQPRRERGVVGEVLPDVVLRQRPLRQQGARDGGEGEQEQQHQRRAHRGELAPPAQQPGQHPSPR